MNQLQTETLLGVCKAGEALENKLDAALLDTAADLVRTFWPEGIPLADIQARLDYALLREQAGTGRPLVSCFAKAKACLAVMESLYADKVAAFRPPCEFVAYVDSGHIGFVVVSVAYDPARPSYPAQSDRATALIFAEAQAREQTEPVAA